MIEIVRKRPRKPRVWRNYLTMHNGCKPCGECPGCIARMQEQVNNERPGHVWAVEDGKVIYLADKVAWANPWPSTEKQRTRSPQK